MAKRPVSGSKKERRKLARVDPRRALAIPEFDKVKAWAEGTLRAAMDSGPLIVRNAAITLMLLGTAARRFELCAFRCGDFRKDYDKYTCYFEQGKGNVEAVVPISKETWDHVQTWLAFKRQNGESTAADAALVCGRAGEHLSVAQLHNIWVDVLKLSGVQKRKGIGVHMTRHTAGFLLLRSTKSLPDVSKFMRHASIEITERFYKHVLDDDVFAGLTKAGL